MPASLAEGSQPRFGEGFLDTGGTYGFGTPISSSDVESGTAQEDLRIVELVAKYGAKKWSLIASELQGRIGKQCRERCGVCVRQCTGPVA
jgi:hypothetical protein